MRYIVINLIRFIERKILIKTQYSIKIPSETLKKKLMKKYVPEKNLKKKMNFTKDRLIFIKKS